MQPRHHGLEMEEGYLATWSIFMRRARTCGQKSSINGYWLSFQLIVLMPYNCISLIGSLQGEGALVMPAAATCSTAGVWRLLLTG